MLIVCRSSSTTPSFPNSNRCGHGTSHALLVLKANIISQLNNNIPTTACLIDIQKAFDAVWQEGLIFKLSHTFKLLLNLSDRQALVRIKENLTEPYNPPAGIPQKSVLSGTLFSLYTVDISLQQFTNSLQAAKVIQYVNDLILYILS